MCRDDLTSGVVQVLKSQVDEALRPEGRRKQSRGEEGLCWVCEEVGRFDDVSWLVQKEGVTCVIDCDVKGGNFLRAQESKAIKKNACSDLYLMLNVGRINQCCIRTKHYYLCGACRWEGRGMREK